MINNKKGFTIIELIIVISIIAILSTIGVISTSMIGDSNLQNKINESITFVSDLKWLLIQNPNSEIYLYLSKDDNNNLNKYIFGYNKKYNCEHITDIDKLFFENYRLDDNNNAYFTGTVLSGSLTLNIMESISKYQNIESSEINKLHNVSTGNMFLYKLYGTGEVVTDGETYTNPINCGDIYVYFLDNSIKDKYYINSLLLKINDISSLKDNLILKYNSNNLKGELYFGSTKKNRYLYDEIIISVGDTVNDIFYEGIIK